MKPRPLPLAAIGLSYREATLATREPIALASDDIERALTRWHAAGVTGFILSTCQRTELYFRADAAAEHAVPAAFRERDPRGVTRALASARVRTGTDVARHLFRVASGLDSSALGEHEVIGQVRRAVLHARSVGVLDALTNRLGDTALLAGKRVRRETTLALHPASLASLAIAEATRQIGGLRDRRVVVLGAGHMARVALRELRGAAPADLIVIGRTPAHAATAAEAFGARTEPWEGRAAALVNADVVVCCAAAPQPVITSKMLDAARAQRASVRDALPVFVDLAIPRGIARRASDAADNNIIDLDSLASRNDHGTALMTAAIHAAESIVGDETHRLDVWWSRRADTGLPHSTDQGRRAAS